MAKQLNVLVITTAGTSTHQAKIRPAWPKRY